MNINTYYCLYLYCNHTETVVSPVSDEKRFPRVWRKANSFWEEKKHVELLSDTGLIKVLNKLPVNDSVIEQVTSRPIACLIWLLDWLINLIDQSSYLLYCLNNRHSDWHDWMTFWLTDDCWTYWYNWLSYNHLPHVPNCLTYLAYWLTNILTALLTKRHTNGQTDRLIECCQTNLLIDWHTDSTVTGLQVDFLSVRWTSGLVRVIKAQNVLDLMLCIV